MRKFFAIFLLTAVCLLFSSGCSLGNDNAGNLMKRNVTITLGKEYSTLWFDFTILSVEEVSEYAGYSANDGYKLIDVLVTETSTFEDPIPMGTFDFYVDCEAYFDYVSPLEAFDDSMMPEEFWLSYGQTAQYHMVFEIPIDTYDPILMYTEFDEDDQEGTTYMLSF